MDDERARVADVGQMREEFDRRHRLDTRIITALEAKGENGARTFRAIFLLQRVMLVVGKSCVVDPRHLRMLLQPFRDLQRVVAVALHAERQGFHAGQDEEGVEGRNRRSQVAKA